MDESTRLKYVLEGTVPREVTGKATAADMAKIIDHIVNLPFFRKCRGFVPLADMYPSDHQRKEFQRLPETHILGVNHMTQCMKLDQWYVNEIASGTDRFALEEALFVTRKGRYIAGEIHSRIHQFGWDYSSSEFRALEKEAVEAYLAGCTNSWRDMLSCLARNVSQTRQAIADELPKAYALETKVVGILTRCLGRPA